MLLNYLYANFTEESAFAEQLHIPLEALLELIKRRVFPSPSYVIGLDACSHSFVSEFNEKATYNFHLKGYSDWFEKLGVLELDTEERAKSYFTERYDIAKSAFFSSQFGQALTAISPSLPRQFDLPHAQMTWRHFLKGVYGVCTRDGQPETVFLKQAGVMFIEAMSQEKPHSLSVEKHALLAKAVTFLEVVESDFAPHEVAQSSRQRCIIDIREQYLNHKAA